MKLQKCEWNYHRIKGFDEMGSFVFAEKLGEEWRERKKETGNQHQKCGLLLFWVGLVWWCVNSQAMVIGLYETLQFVVSVISSYL